MTKIDLEVLDKKQRFKIRELKIKEELLHRGSLVLIWVAGAFILGFSIGKLF